MRIKIIMGLGDGIRMFLPFLVFSKFSVMSTNYFYGQKKHRLKSFPVFGDRALPGALSLPRRRPALTQNAAGEVSLCLLGARLEVLTLLAYILALALPLTGCGTMDRSFYLSEFWGSSYLKRRA